MSRNLRHEARVLLAHPWGWIASGCGSGFSPKAPGTAGSAAIVLVYWLSGALQWSPWTHLGIVAGGFALGVAASGWAVRALESEDASVIVVDEWVGQWLTLAAAQSLWPFEKGAWALPAFFATGFVLFRIADILKPWPASLADRTLGGGFGAMFDDLLAALYSAAALCALAWILGRP